MSCVITSSPAFISIVYVKFKSVECLREDECSQGGGYKRPNDFDIRSASSEKYAPMTRSATVQVHPLIANSMLFFRPFSDACIASREARLKTNKLDRAVAMVVSHRRYRSLVMW